MAFFTAYYFVTESGRSPVRDFIDSLDSRSQRKFFFAKALLEEFGHKLVLPHAKYIGNEIFELRFSGSEGQIRILYFFYHYDQVVFTNGFVKKSNRVPQKEKMLAVNRRRTFFDNQLEKEGVR